MDRLRAHHAHEQPHSATAHASKPHQLADARWYPLPTQLSIPIGDASIGRRAQLGQPISQRHAFPFRTTTGCARWTDRWTTPFQRHARFAGR